MRQLLALASLALGLLSVNPSPALACSCVDLLPMTATQYRDWLDEHVDVLVQGTVTGIEERVTKTFFGAAPSFWFTVKVERLWKGSRVPTLTVYSPVSTDSCGVRLELDRVYILAIHRTEGGWYTGSCDRLMVRDERALRDALGEGAPPPKP